MSDTLEMRCSECADIIATVSIDAKAHLQKLVVVCPSCITVNDYGKPKAKVDELKHIPAGQTRLIQPSEVSKKSVSAKQR